MSQLLLGRVLHNDNYLTRRDLRRNSVAVFWSGCSSAAPQLAEL
jgi:hypothetical protein